MDYCGKRTNCHLELNHDGVCCTGGNARSRLEVELASCPLCNQRITAVVNDHLIDDTGEVLPVDQFLHFHSREP